jgi:cellobiose phosphorylase
VPNTPREILEQNGHQLYQRDFATSDSSILSASKLKKECLAFFQTSRGGKGFSL